MMNRKQIEQAVLSQKQPEMILPQALNMISSDYYTYSALQFTINYYNYFEMTTKLEIPEVDAKLVLINNIVQETLLTSFDGQKREEAIIKVDAIRNDVIGTMQELTELADEFSIMEYVINRVEKKFDKELVDIDNDAVMKDLMQRIFADNDQLLINTRIRSMLSQLPVRISKNKFFDMLRDSLSIYEGSDKSSVSDYLYMILCASGLLSSEKEKKDHKNPVIQELNRQLKFLKELDMTMIKEEELRNAQDILTLAVEKIQNTTDRCYSLQEVINAFYSLLLNQPYASTEAQDQAKPLKEIVIATSQAIKEGKKDCLGDEIVDMFEYTEGKLEQYIQYLSKDESILERMEQSNQEMITSFMLSNQLSSLSLSKNLTGNSVFIDLHGKADKGKADKVFLNQKYEELIIAFTKALGSKNKLHNRAIIAAALREMPVLFRSMNEVRDYIKTSLLGCHDIVEKLASVELCFAAMD